MGMTDRTTRIREEAAGLLARGRVDLVIGFEEGSLPMRATPCFITRSDDVGRLVWNSFCSNNLARYLIRSEGKVGIVAKGCDTRAIVELIKEKQIRREGVVIIGVPCQGMIDPRKVRERLGDTLAPDMDDTGGYLTAPDGTAPATATLEELLHASCRVCRQRNPVISDVLVGEEVEERIGDDFADVSDFASRPPGERWEHIAGETGRCIRCNACRNACPLCYCSKCFVDETRPQWLGRGTDPSDVLSFHLMRALHLAGRCVECGACMRACPLEVDLGTLNRKMSADVMRLFGCRPGLDPGKPAPLSTFDPDDPQEFMLEQ